MKIAMIGDIQDQPDGSATAKLDINEEGKMYLMQLGLEVLIMRGINAMKEEHAVIPFI